MARLIHETEIDEMCAGKYDEGWSDGYEKGKDEGYQEGWEDGARWQIDRIVPFFTNIINYLKGAQAYLEEILKEVKEDAGTTNANDGGDTRKNIDG